MTYSEKIELLIAFWVCGWIPAFLIAVPVYAWNGWCFKKTEEFPISALWVVIFWPFTLCLLLAKAGAVILLPGLTAVFNGIERLEQAGEDYRARRLNPEDRQALRKTRLNLPIVADDERSLDE